LSGAFTKPKATTALEHLLEEKHIKIESDFAIERIDNEQKTIIDYGGRVFLSICWSPCPPTKATN
jgi:sulfide:quinone oxidoreductase